MIALHKMCDNTGQWKHGIYCSSMVKTGILAYFTQCWKLKKISRGTWFLITVISKEFLIANLWALRTGATFSWNCNKFFKLLQFHEKILSVPGYFSFVAQHFFLKKFVSAIKKNFKSIWNSFLLLKQIFWEKREFVKKVNKNHVSPHLQHELMQHNSF